MPSMRGGRSSIATRRWRPGSDLEPARIVGRERRISFGAGGRRRSTPDDAGAAHRFVPAAASVGRRAVRGHGVCVAATGDWCIGRRSSCRCVRGNGESATERSGVLVLLGRGRHVAAGTGRRAFRRADGRRIAPHDPPLSPRSGRSVLASNRCSARVRRCKRCGPKSAAAAASGANTLIIGPARQRPGACGPGDPLSRGRRCGREARARRLRAC